MNRNDVLSTSAVAIATPTKSSSIGISASQSQSTEPARGTPPSTSTPASVIQQGQSSFFGSTSGLTITPPNSAGLKVPSKFPCPILIHESYSFSSLQLQEQQHIVYIRKKMPLSLSLLSLLHKKSIRKQSSDKIRNGMAICSLKISLKCE